MKHKLFTTLMSFLILTGFFHLVKNNVDVDYMPDVMAAVAEMGPSVACTDPSIAAFQGSLAYTVTWAVAAAGAASNPSATVSISNPVNGDAAPGVTATLNGSGAPLGFVVLVSPSPTGKVGGLQCQSGTDELKIEVNGDGTNNTNHNIALQNLADENNIYTAADQTDDAPLATKDVLYGTNGQISSSLLLDGTRDFDTFNDGEITYGGTNETNGGMELHVITDVTNYNVLSDIDLETLTMTLTPQ